MSKKGTNDRSAKVAKAGKRSGGFISPPPLNLDKLAAREAGEQQFIAPKQLTVEKEVNKFDQNKMRFITRKVQVPVDFIFDATRGRAVMSPRFQGKKEK